MHTYTHKESEKESEKERERVVNNKENIHNLNQYDGVCRITLSIAAIT